MGTSKSSAGPKSGVPLVPPWSPALPNQNSSPQNKPSDKDSAKDKININPKLNTISPKAEDGRFRSSRGNLGNFAKDGNSSNLRRGLGGYVKSGLGGKKQATRRFAGTVNTAGALYNVLDALSGNRKADGHELKNTVLQGKTGDEIASAVVDAIRPLDGTQDAESARASVNDALVDLLENYPDADLLDLDETQKLFVVEGFIASDIYRRLVLDVGAAVRSKAPNASIASSRFREIKEFVRQTVSHAMRETAGNKKINYENIRSISRSVLETSFSIFEEYY